MTPFWVESSPSNLFASSAGIVSCARTICDADDVLEWKIGLDVRLAIFKNSVGISEMTPEMETARERLNLGEHDMMFCGLRAVVVGTFPSALHSDVMRRCAMLFSDKRGHIGTVHLVNLGEFGR